MLLEIIADKLKIKGELWPSNSMLSQILIKSFKRCIEFDCFLLSKQILKQEIWTVLMISSIFTARIR